MARLEALIDTLDRSRKRIVIALAMAIVLHVPATPVTRVLRVLRILRTPEPASVQQQPRPIEVELQDAVRREDLRTEQRNARPDRESLAVTSQFAPSPAPTADPKNADEPKDRKKEKFRQVGLEGIDNTVTSRPGMTLGIWLSVLRDNPLGKRVSEIAVCNREWKIFADHGVDLINDFEGALVVGPTLFDSKEMTVAVRHSLPKDRVHDVVDGLVHESGPSGRWMQADVAAAKIGKAQRILLPQQEDLFFVAPSKGWETLHNVKRPLRVPTAEGRLFSIALVPPQKALARAGLSLPKRFSELRLEAFANTDGSSDMRVELVDASAEAAENDVEPISKTLHDFFADVWVFASTLGTLTGASGADAPRELAPSLDLSVDGRTLTGMIHLSQAQTRTAVELSASLMCRKHKRGAQNANR